MLLRVYAIIVIFLAYTQGDVFAVVTNASDQSEVLQGLGPLMIRSQSPAQALRFTPVARNPYLPASGQSQLRAMSNVSNIWANPDDHQYFLDYDTRDIRLAMAFGLPAGWAIEFAINDLRIIHSGLDQLTSEFHDLFDIDQNGRGDVPKNDTRISFPAYGVELDRSDVKGLTRSIDATLSKVLVKEKSSVPAVSLSGTIRYELRDDGPVEEGAIDLGLIAGLAKRLGQNYMYLNIGYTHFGSSKFITIPLEKTQLNGMLAYEWRTRPNQALLLQYSYSEGVVKDLGELSQASHEISLGYKWRLKHFMWELSINENIINYENSPDVGFTLGLVYAF